MRSRNDGLCHEEVFTLQVSATLGKPKELSKWVQAMGKEIPNGRAFCSSRHDVQQKKPWIPAASCLLPVLVEFKNEQILNDELLSTGCHNMPTSHSWNSLLIVFCLYTS